MSRAKRSNKIHALWNWLNGPRELDRIASAKYARAWITKVRMKTDDSINDWRRTNFEIIGADDEMDL